MMENEYISVRDYAEFIGKTTQQVYNMLHDGRVAGFEFHRGKMRGWLCMKPSGYDKWKLENE